MDERCHLPRVYPSSIKVEKQVTSRATDLRTFYADGTGLNACHWAAQIPGLGTRGMGPSPTIWGGREQDSSPLLAHLCVLKVIRVSSDRADVVQMENMNL